MDTTRGSEFTYLSPFFQTHRIRRNKQPVASTTPCVEEVEVEEEDESMVGVDREHETKKKKHNAILGRNFFVRSTNQANRSIIKATTGRIPRKKVVPLYSPEDADVVEWNQVHTNNETIQNENENIVVLSRILEIEPKPGPTVASGRPVWVNKNNTG